MALNARNGVRFVTSRVILYELSEKQTAAAKSGKARHAARSIYLACVEINQ